VSLAFSQAYKLYENGRKNGKMARVLVTGCAGFIGSHLVERLLKENNDVIGIDCFTDYYPEEQKLANLSRALNQERFTIIRQDILEMDRFPRADHVFHLAAQPGVRASWGPKFTIYTKNNVEATQRLLEFYRSTELKSFIHSSSSSVYGDAELPMKEDARPLPVSPYGVTKLAAENLCYLYWKNYGVPIVSLRYFTVYGPRQRPDMAIHRFVHAMLNGRELQIYGDGLQLRDFTFVGDVVDALILAAQSDVKGEVLNIGGGHTISVNALIRSIESLVGKKARVRHVEQQKGDARDTLADTTKAKQLLSWKPQTDLQSGLKAYIAWVLNNRVR
jgi:nucleoside-diphosphate-sugar epimerase